MKLHPVKFGFLPNIFVTYGIENGRAFIRRRSLIGYSRGGPHVELENVSRIWATGKFVGDVSFGEGSHTPVVWQGVQAPQRLRDVAEAERQACKDGASSLGAQPHTGRDYSKQLIATARSTHRTGFGSPADHSSARSPVERLEGTAWTINGDGTATNHDSNTMWVQGLWGQVWDGRAFTGNSVDLSWRKATKLFGRGVYAAYSEKTSVSDDPDTWSETAVALGYKPGTCTVEFAGHEDWRLPTALEACQLAIRCIGGPDSYVVNKLFPSRFNGFISASGAERWLGLPSTCWKGRKGMAPNDENPDIAYPILFCRHA